MGLAIGLQSAGKGWGGLDKGGLDAIEKLAAEKIPSPAVYAARSVLEQLGIKDALLLLPALPEAKGRAGALDKRTPGIMAAGFSLYPNPTNGAFT